MVLETEGPPSTSSSAPASKTHGRKKTTKKARARQGEDGPTGVSSLSTRPVYRRRTPRVGVRIGRRHVPESEADAIGFPLGMSLAAVLAQALERDSSRETMSVDYLSQICTSAVRESLSNVFGDKFSGFSNNFEMSFISTLRTLRLINGCSSQRATEFSSGSTSRTPSLVNKASPQTGMGASPFEHVYCMGDSYIVDDCKDTLQNTEDDLPAESMNHCEIISQAPINQLACITRSQSGPNFRRSMCSTFEKSVMEHTRSNDLKTVQLQLQVEKLKLKEKELALINETNIMERSKFAMRTWMASFKAEKFKTVVEDSRHAELRRRCLDCLVAGLLIMLISLVYGAYIFSYRRISEATASCAPLTKQTKSWWVPGPVASLNSGFEMLQCQIQVLSRMLFGILMIFAITYLLLQRSSPSNQTMPITFLLLLLGVSCGFAGKFCLDALGGSGFHWLLIWELLCLVHFFANTFTSVLFLILHGPLNAALEPKERAVILPYWTRRVIFYIIILLFLPLLCGFMPFGSAHEWKNHFTQLATNWLLVTNNP
ncbi:hypothetical protein SAY86_018043 [Trapa natans]|uniref:Protein CPR-5 n=1 Tax=Trapa natans TaxID=22666 RepID=A0AAN7LTK4_TRANT|nr:hypothetical protein SAY86_018043 [Trapa natans]